jgi:hypothetical protein
VTWRIAPPGSTLILVRYVLDAGVGLLYGVYIDSALFRIVASAPHLRSRYREAYQNSVQ